MFGIFFEVRVRLQSEYQLAESLVSSSGVTSTIEILKPRNGRSFIDFSTLTVIREINHAGTGGLWAELVSNRGNEKQTLTSTPVSEIGCVYHLVTEARTLYLIKLHSSKKTPASDKVNVKIALTKLFPGFEAGGPNTPSNIDPWLIIGDESSIIVGTDRTSCFARNPIALRMEVLCDSKRTNACPSGGVGVYNPGYWGMNIEKGKVYKVSMHIMSSDAVSLTVSLTSSDGRQKLAAHTITGSKKSFAKWTKIEFNLKSRQNNTNSRLQLTTSKSGVIWLDQVSLMPLDTYMGHGFRKDLSLMLANLKPQFLKFPGGNYAMGNYLRNAFRWSETVGPWEERPGHFNDAWGYWTDDGLGFFEFLQLAEDLGASPVWVVNDGASLNEEVSTATIASLVKDVVDGIEFARGGPKTPWGSVRAAMGHPEPFKLDYVSKEIKNVGCSTTEVYHSAIYPLALHMNSRNYQKFYSAIKAAYPEVNITSSCDRSTISPSNPADLYDVHAIVSEYAVTGNDAGKGTLVAALAEAAFLIGLERNSDVVEMASCAPLFVNDNDRRWSPDAIVFNSWQHYGCPNYWMLHFKDSSGAALHPTNIQISDYDQLVASAITWQNAKDKSNYLRIKVVNFGNRAVDLNISVAGLANGIEMSGSKQTVLTSSNPLDENSLLNESLRSEAGYGYSYGTGELRRHACLLNGTVQVAPVSIPLANAKLQMGVSVRPYSLTSFDVLLEASKHCQHLNSEAAAVVAAAARANPTMRKDCIVLPEFQ
ncbi:alpha-L-arabinofuranosidase 1-like [Panicum miliaceum]|uniref:non-reducing end alpha-L-arabinofuranosidase n=1 Tax=Panicum miliaceum TaxID=4540 RepID=A0A3L6TA36_PANMI|nr:alpha-L-arabinofuranosidase 1-like [Panicum miliaceum]